MLASFLFLCSALAFAEPITAEVVLDDGQVLRGVVERQEDGSVVLTLGSGTMLRFPSAAIREVRPVSATPTPAPEVKKELPLPGEAPGARTTTGGWPADPNRSRYLYSPSAFSLGKGRGYVSQKELVITEAAFGLTDWWDIQAGTSVITLLIPGGEFALLGTKFSLNPAKDFRIGVGGQALVTSDPAFVLGFVNATYGNEDKHITLAVGGLTTILDGTAGAPGGALVTLSGNIRLGAKAALITENWFFVGESFSPTGSAVWLVPSLAVRLFGPSFATDLGLVPIFTGSSPVVLPIPWVGFTWNFALPYADK